MPHIHDKIDFTVDVFLVYNNTVLLRKHDKYKKWFAVGGHIELDEDPTQAAVREVKEEVGIDIVLSKPEQSWNSEESTDLLPPVFLNRHHLEKGNSHEHISFVYFATSPTQDIVEGENENGGGFHWFTKEELKIDETILPRVKFYALKALETLGN